MAEISVLMLMHARFLQVSTTLIDETGVCCRSYNPRVLFDHGLTQLVDQPSSLADRCSEGSDLHSEQGPDCKGSKDPSGFLFLSIWSGKGNNSPALKACGRPHGTRRGLCSTETEKPTTTTRSCIPAPLARRVALLLTLFPPRHPEVSPAMITRRKENQS